MGELYGELDKFTGEWVDGLASHKIREANFWNDPQVHHWIVFDGPVDALWIENMNTVLDDNNILCLANSERIKLKHTLKMVFEVEDLAVASPATVSRCGMLYLPSDILDWKIILQNWLEN